MTDLITAEEAKKLLVVAVPGPWRVDGEPWNRIVWSSAENRVCFMAHSSGLNDERDIATSNLAAAAPDLARALLAAHADAEAAVALALEEASNGNRPIPFDRDTAGRFVREAWVRWAETQPCPKPSWLVPYDELDEEDKEADRQIGEAVARWALIHDAARASLATASGVAKLAALRERAEKAEADMRVWMLTAQLADQRATDLTAELAAAHDKYQRDVFGLNNEGDPIGGDPPSGLKQRADKAEAELAAANAREAGLRDFIGDFANAKIDALRYQPSYGESPEDEPDPVVDAETVWAWQADAKAALSAAQPAGMAGKGE